MIAERGGSAKIEGLTLTNKEILEIALESGFKLKVQEGGRLDLNPYVYRFVRAILRRAKP